MSGAATAVFLFARRSRRRSGVHRARTSPAGLAMTADAVACGAPLGLAGPLRQRSLSACRSAARSAAVRPAAVLPSSRTRGRRCRPAAARLAPRSIPTHRDSVRHVARVPSVVAPRRILRGVPIESLRRALAADVIDVVDRPANVVDWVPRAVRLHQEVEVDPMLGRAIHLVVAAQRCKVSRSARAKSPEPR